MKLFNTASNMLSSWVTAASGNYYLGALIITVIYFVSYLMFPYTPGNLEQYFMAWFGWSDQSLYLESAKAIAGWKLSPATYVYPLGYPLLGAFFVKWLPRHLFLIPNLIFTVGIVLAFYASSRKFISTFEGIFITAFLIICSAFTSNHVTPGGLIWFQSLIIPWNLIPVFFAAYFTAWLLVFNKADWLKLWVASLVIALAFFARPPDILFLGIIYLAGLTDMKSIKEKAWGMVILIIPSLLVLTIILFTKWKIFGSFVSPYDLNVSEQGFNFHNLLYKFYLVFFDGSPVYGYRELMFVPQMPWLLFCIPGIFFLAQKTNGKFWYLATAIGVCLTLYVSYNALTPATLFMYYGYRYFIWIFPWLGLCAYLTITRSASLFGLKRTIAGALIGVLLAVIIGWKETTISVVTTGDKTSIERFDQSYDVVNKRLESKIYLHALTPANGLKLIFSKPLSNNLSVAGSWSDFNLEIDGKKQKLFKDYSLNQLGNIVYVAFSHPTNDTGELEKATLQIGGTELAELKSIEVMGKEFEFFGFLKNLRKNISNNPISISYDATLAEGIQFAEKQGYPLFLKSVTGMSSYETAGRWTEGEKVVFTFDQNLPANFMLKLNSLGAYGTNAGKDFKVQVGDWQGKFVASAEPKAYELSVTTQVSSDTIELFVPQPQSPKELGASDDSRMLGIMLKNMSIVPID